MVFGLLQKKTDEDILINLKPNIIIIVVVGEIMVMVAILEEP